MIKADNKHEETLSFIQSAYNLGKFVEIVSNEHKESEPSKSKRKIQFCSESAQNGDKDRTPIKKIKESKSGELGLTSYFLQNMDKPSEKPKSRFKVQYKTKANPGTLREKP